MRVAGLLDEDHRCFFADAAAARWGRDHAVFVRSSASHVFRAVDLVLRMAPLGSPQAAAVARSATTAQVLAAAGGDAVTSPMQGTIVKVAVEEGQTVAEGDVVVVLEAMKMEQPLKAHKAGMVTGLQAEVGATVTNGAVICELKD